MNIVRGCLKYYVLFNKAFYKFSTVCSFSLSQILGGLVNSPVLKSITSLHFKRVYKNALLNG